MTINRPALGKDAWTIGDIGRRYNPSQDEPIRVLLIDKCTKTVMTEANPEWIDSEVRVRGRIIPIYAGDIGSPLGGTGVCAIWNAGVLGDGEDSEHVYSNAIHLVLLTEALGKSTVSAAP